MKKIPPQVQIRWIDQKLAQQGQTQKQNVDQLNKSAQTENLNKKRTNKTKNFLFQLPFSQRFKDKFFAFDKIGQMYKLEENKSPSIKASLIFSKNKLNKNNRTKSVFRKNKNLISIIGTNQSSRVSIQTQDTQRQTKSLDASKVTAIFAKQYKPRYAPDCSLIKQQDIEQTIIKKPQLIRKTLTPLEVKRKKPNTKRAIYFQSQGTIEQSQLNQKQEKKARLFFRRKNQGLKETSNQNCEKKLPELINRPNESYISKRISINVSKRNSRYYTKDENGQQLLPKMKFPNSKKNTQQQKQRLCTIR